MSNGKFYMMGSFRKRKRCAPYFDTKKPFEIDSKRGEIKPCVFHFYKTNMFFDEWELIEGYYLSDLRSDSNLQSHCNEIWKSWCKKHNRKYTALFEVKDGV